MGVIRSYLVVRACCNGVDPSPRYLSIGLDVLIMFEAINTIILWRRTL